jgi:hypothetical protein
MRAKNRRVKVKDMRAKKGRFKVGDWVSFPSIFRNKLAQVIEERGPLGVKGRHIYRIRIADETELEAFEMPEDELQPVPPPDKTAVMKYLKEGGLEAILRSNFAAEPKQPKVWLTYTREGDLTPTSLAMYGVVGGGRVPYFALHTGLAFTGKPEEVLAFLGSFGLTRSEAEEVLATVGTAP